MKPNKVLSYISPAPVFSVFCILLVKNYYHCFIWSVKQWEIPLLLFLIRFDVPLIAKIDLQEEDSEEYGSPMVLASAIADLIRSRTEAHLRKVQAAVSAKPIVMRAEYAHCPNLTIIDTPGFVLKVLYLVHM